MKESVLSRRLGCTYENWLGDLYLLMCIEQMKHPSNRSDARTRMFMPFRNNYHDLYAMNIETKAQFLLLICNKFAIVRAEKLLGTGETRL